MTLFVLALLTSFQSTAHASPYGQGVFGADVPFGSLTSMSIALGSNVALSLSSNGTNLSGTGSHTITVTSNDVVGYRLYVYGLGSTNMVGSTATIPASLNTTAGALAVNTWGYNTDGTSNFLGMTTTPSVLKDANGPYKNGDNTTVTYGALTDKVKPAGDYKVTVVYTAVAKNQ
jgi:hypothetical protein